MERTARYLFAMLWGAVPALLLFLCLRPVRRERLRRRGLYSPAPREAVLALLYLFCGGMAVVTLTPYWVPASLVDLLHGYGWNAGGHPFFHLGRINLEPFQTFYSSPFAIYNLVGNVVMFTPFGFLPALLWHRLRWWQLLPAGALLTLSIECWQLLVGRAFDVDDLMLNTLGVLCGFWAALVIRRYFPRSSARSRVRPL